MCFLIVPQKALSLGVLSTPILFEKVRRYGWLRNPAAGTSAPNHGFFQSKNRFRLKWKKTWFFKKNASFFSKLWLRHFWFNFWNERFGGQIKRNGPRKELSKQIWKKQQDFSKKQILNFKLGIKTMVFQKNCQIQIWK